MKIINFKGPYKSVLSAIMKDILITNQMLANIENFYIKYDNLNNEKMCINCKNTDFVDYDASLTQINNYDNLAENF